MTAVYHPPGFVAKIILRSLPVEDAPEPALPVLSLAEGSEAEGACPEP